MAELQQYTKEQKIKMETWLVNTLQKCKDGELGVQDKRAFTYERIELVIYASEIVEWLQIFEQDYDGVRKPAGEKPTDDDLRLTHAYGGVNEIQVLFACPLDDELTAIAMFWPWNDSEHVTLHMAFCRNNYQPPATL